MMNSYSEFKVERTRWREVLPVKYTPSKFADNLYQQSGQWIKSCSDCTPNSYVLYDSKEKNYYFVNLLDDNNNNTSLQFDPIAYYMNWMKWNSTTTTLTGGDNVSLVADVLNNPNLREFIDYNVRGETTSTTPGVVGSNRTKLAKCIREKLRDHLATILGRFSSLSSSSSSTHSDYALKISLLVLRTVLKLCFSQILCYSVHLSGLHKAQTKQLPLVYVIDGRGGGGGNNEDGEFVLSSLILQLTLISNGFKPASLFLPTTTEQRSSSALFFSLLDMSRLVQRVLDYFGVRRVDQRMLTASMLLDESRRERDQAVASVSLSSRRTDASSSLFQQQQQTLEGNSSTDNVVLYRQALLAYLHEALKNEEALCMTVNDFSLDLITKLIESETVHDALVVPVSVCYELTSSYSYLSNELLDYSSSATSSSFTNNNNTVLRRVARFVRTSANLISFFSTRFAAQLFRRNGGGGSSSTGQARVNFGQAYSLKEFIETKMNKRSYSLTAAGLKEAPPTRSSDYYTRRAIETELRMHLKYDINQCGSVMCTNIVAFVLLNNYHHAESSGGGGGGTTSQTLTQRFSEIRTKLAVSHQLGFLVKTDQEAVNYCLHLLKPYLIIEQQQQRLKQKKNKNNENCCLLIRPRDASSACILFKHGRVVGRAFFLRSVMACAINSTLGGKSGATTTTGGGGNSLSQCMMMRTSPIVYERDLMKRCFEIIRLFQYEFDTYKKPCEPISTRLVNILGSHEMLMASGSGGNNNNNSSSMYRAKFRSNFGFESDDENDHHEYSVVANQSKRLVSPPVATVEQFNLSRIYTENLIDNREMDEWALDPTYKSYLLKLSPAALTDLKFFVNMLQPYVRIYQHTISHILGEMQVGRLYAETEILDIIHAAVTQHSSSRLDIGGDYQLQVESLDYFVRCRLVSKIDSVRGAASAATAHVVTAANPPQSSLSGYVYRVDTEQRARLDQLALMLNSIF